MKINLGVIDIPYTYGDDKGKTTYQVARDLEMQYRLFTHFFEIHRDEILGEVGNEMVYSIVNQIEHNVEINGELNLEQTKLAFHRFLENQELDGKVDGVPTKASLLGVNSRLKKEKGAPRPSFIDGGLLQASFQAWVEK